MKTERATQTHTHLQNSNKILFLNKRRKSNHMGRESSEKLKRANENTSTQTDRMV